MAVLTPERANFLLQCCKQRRFGDGARFLAHPIRVSLYRLKKQATASSAANEVDPPGNGPEMEPLSTRIHSVFGGVAPAGVMVAGVARLFEEADAHAAGFVRLAGGVLRPWPGGGPAGFEEEEDRHAFHRLYWSVRLARACAFGHPAAGQALRDGLLQWFDSSTDSSRDAVYTVAERIASLAEVLFWCSAAEAALEPRMILRIRQQVRRDARHLFQHCEFHLGIHNHLLNDARGLYAASALLPECAEAGDWRCRAFGLWDRYFPLLVLPDGALAEQSSHYHLLLCRTVLEYVLASRAAFHDLPDGMADRIQAMFQLADDLVRADGSAPRFGDNSPDHSVEDLWGLLAAAYSHGLLREPPRHWLVTPLSLFYGVARGASPRPAPGRSSRLYPKGGFAFLSALDGEVQLAAHADPQPGSGVHGDSGRGSFELWRRGQVIIREPGCFLSRTSAHSAWYRSADAQNVTSIEGLAPAVSRDDQLRLPAWYWNKPSAWYCRADLALAFECGAFARLRPDLTLARSWSLDVDGNLTFEEWLRGAGSARLESRVFLGDGQWGSLRPLGGAVWELRRRPGGLQSVRLLFRLPPGVTPVVRETRFTPEYGVELPARAVVWAGAVPLPCRWTLRCEFSDAAEPDPRA